MARIEDLAERYGRHIATPWQRTVAGAQRVVMVVYDKELERTLRARKLAFETATREAGHDWVEIDLTPAFAEWTASSVCSARSRGLVAVERSMFARQTLSSVLTAALTMPGRSLMASNSPRLKVARAARIASWSFSGSIGCRNPPARRPASCPMVMTCSPLAPLLAAATRIM